MKAYEVLLQAKPILDKLEHLNVGLKDVRYLDIYIEFQELKKSGMKVRAIATTLSDKHKISESCIFKFIKRLNQKV